MILFPGGKLLPMVCRSTVAVGLMPTPHGGLNYFLSRSNALLVAGLTLVLWIPEQILFASTSSYSSLVQRLPA